MMVNAEILARGLRAAYREGDARALGRWVESVVEFMKRQDQALKDAREGMRHAMEAARLMKVERDACLRRLGENDEEIVRLRALIG